MDQEVSGMTSASKVLRYVAFGLTVFLAVLGSAFIIGEALTDPGGFPAVLLSACWFVPTAALAVYALRRPEPATTVLTVVTALVASFVVLDGVFGIVPRDEIGPVASITVFAVAVPLGFLGLHRPLRAGWLLLLVGAANLADVLARMLGAGDGPPLGAALGGSSGAVAVPVVIIGGLFLVAASVDPGRNEGSPAAGRTGSALPTESSRRP
jgi:hypothetical protein